MATVIHINNYQTEQQKFLQDLRPAWSRHLAALHDKYCAPVVRLFDGKWDR